MGMVSTWSRTPLSLNPLIAEAKRRMRRRRFLVAVAIVAVGAGVGAAFVLGSSPGGSGSGGPLLAVVRLSAQGIGGVRIGATKAQTVAALSRVFGPPSRRFLSDACGPRYSEVAWGHLYAEFRQDSFSGYRYLSGTWLRTGVFPGRNLSVPRPRLTTAGGITIGDTLGALRRTDGTLTPVGTSRWQSNGGLVFYDNAQQYPDPPSSRITEIKHGTCGDF